MAYKKQILERYQKINDETYVEPLKSNIFTSIGDIDDVICEKNTLEIHNSLLRYENIKLIKENKVLKSKLEDKIEEKKQEINYWETIHWEMIEELKFSEWLYEKENNTKENKTSNKRKVDNTYTQEIKEVKKAKVIIETSIHSTIKTKTSKTQNDDIIVIYDSDETEEENDNYHSQTAIINFDSD